MRYSWPVILFTIFFTGCNDGTSTTATKTTTTDTMKVTPQAHTHPATDVCDSVLRALVLSANISGDLRSYMDSLLVEPNGLDDSVLAVRIYRWNEGHTATLANLSIDTKTRLMYDITNDADSPLLLKCNTALLNFEISHCINWSDNNADK